MIYNVQFIGLTPVENTGQVAFDGDKDEAIEALSDYLTNVYGPNNFKITFLQEAEEVDGELTPFELPINPPTSKVLN